MPKSVEQIRKDAIKKNTDLIAYQATENFISMMEELDTWGGTFMKDSLGGFATAMYNLLYADTKLVKVVDINEAVKTMPELEKYLKDGEGKSNYQRIIDDYSRKNPNVSKQEIEETMDKALSNISRISGEKIDIDKIKEESKKKVFDPKKHKDLRPMNTEKVTDVKKLDEVSNYGKNFLDPGCTDFKNVQALADNLKKVSENTKSEKIRNLADGYRGMINAFQTGKTGLDNQAANRVNVSTNKQQLLKQYSLLEGKLMAGSKDSVYKQMVDSGLNPYTFETGMKAMEDVLHHGINIDHIMKTKDQKLVNDTALNHIETMQKPQNWPNTTYRAEVKEYLAKMMTIRKMVNSVPGKKSSLDGDRITNFAIQDETKKMLNNKHFDDFLNRVVSDEKLSQTALNAAKAENGHGGGLDKMFTAYLTNLPAGELQNDPAIDRYMPKVIDRIEALQTKADAKYKNGKGLVPDKEIAEVIALRELIHVEHNQKSALKVKIPTNGKLPDRIKEIANDQRFKNALTPNNIAKLQKGHGGVMQNDIKKAEAAQLKPKGMGPMGMG